MSPSVVRRRHSERCRRHHREPQQIKGLQRYLSQLPAVLGVLLLIGAIYVVQKEFRHLRLRDIAAALRAIPQTALALSFSLDHPVVFHPHLLRPAGHHLRRPRGVVRPRRLRLVLRLRAGA